MMEENVGQYKVIIEVNVRRIHSLMTLILYIEHKMKPIILEDVIILLSKSRMERGKNKLYLYLFMRLF